MIGIATAFAVGICALYIMALDREYVRKPKRVVISEEGIWLVFEFPRNPRNRRTLIRWNEIQAVNIQLDETQKLDFVSADTYIWLNTRRVIPVSREIGFKIRDAYLNATGSYPRIMPAHLRLVQ